MNKKEYKSDYAEVFDFLMGGHTGGYSFPDSTLYIGTGFEIGGTYETWGLGVFRINGGKTECIASDRTMIGAVRKAREKLQIKL